MTNEQTNTDIVIDLPAARRILATVDAGLCSGLGTPTPGQMCVEAAVCYGLGMPHSDRPVCVAPADREFKIKLNDSPWSSPAARAKGLRRVAIMQLGTAGTDRTEWVRILAELTIRRIVPEALEAAAKLADRRGDATNSVELRQAAQRCRDEGTRESALAAQQVAAADAAAAYAAAYAASNSEPAERDRILGISARCAEEAYERTGSRGVELLRQIEAEAAK